MIEYGVYYATNRKHEGTNRWRPTGYGTDFSEDGLENLRLGGVAVSAERERVDRYLRRDVKFGKGDGKGLAGYYKRQARASSRIRAYREKIEKESSDANQPKAILGSRDMFDGLRGDMLKDCDVLVYIHGFNVDWLDAVGASLALQEVLNEKLKAHSKRLRVVLFTWPSDGHAIPYVSYKSDRSEARASGNAVGRGILKLRDYLVRLRRQGQGDDVELCRQNIHVLCHSMGNYVLQNALEKIAEFTPGSVLPRLVEHVFMCAADVDDTVFEPGGAMARLPEICRQVSVYHNLGDLALSVSDHTKGNPDRLGSAGVAKPNLLHSKIHQVDCTPVVGGLVEHSYYLSGNVAEDVAQSVAEVANEASVRGRRRKVGFSNVWSMVRMGG